MQANGWLKLDTPLALETFRRERYLTVYSKALELTHSPEEAHSLAAQVFDQLALRLEHMPISENCEMYLSAQVYLLYAQQHQTPGHIPAEGVPGDGAESHNANPPRPTAPPPGIAAAHNGAAAQHQADASRAVGTQTGPVADGSMSAGATPAASAPVQRKAQPSQGFEPPASGRGAAPAPGAPAEL
ncbi:MAG: hypothetical protein GX418_15005 [Clostridiales bacterium]|nr:hypothetical protein [Clostridiales bacterium]